MSSNPIGTTGRINNWKTTRDQIVVEDGFNVRFDLGDVDQLGESIAIHGIKRSLNVQRNADGKFVVRDGHRRLAAVDSAIKRGLIDAATFEIPVVIEDKNMSVVDSLILMAIANDGKALLPLEEAQLYKRLRDEGLTILDVCKQVGRGDVHVRDRLALLTASPEVVEAVKAGTLGATLAQQIVNFAKKDHGKQAALVAEATSAEGKKKVKESVDGDTKKKIALRMKVAEIEETLAETSAKLAAKLEKKGWKMKDVKAAMDAVDTDLWDLAKMVGAKTALQKLVNAAQPDTE